MESAPLHPRSRYGETRVAVEPTFRMGDDRRSPSPHRDQRIVDSREATSKIDATYCLRECVASALSPAEVRLFWPDKMWCLRRWVSYPREQLPGLLLSPKPRNVHEPPDNPTRRG